MEPGRPDRSGERSNPPGPIHLIVNPNSGRCRTPGFLERIERAVCRLGGSHTIHRTQATGHGRRLAREAAEAGAGLVVAVGGDGTLHETVDGVLTAKVSPPPVALVPAGRGSDFARSFGIPLDVDEALTALDAPAVPIDVGRVAMAGETRHFVNVADVGLGAHVVSVANRWALPVPGSVSYFLGTARSLLSHTGFPMTVEWDGADAGSAEGRFVDVAVANGRYFGGGMVIAPAASPTDGLFDVVVIREVGLLRTLGIGPYLYGGRIASHPAVSVYRCRRLTITSPDPLCVNLDGEETSRVPATIEMLPGALAFKLPSRCQAATR